MIHSKETKASTHDFHVTTKIAKQGNDYHLVLPAQSSLAAITFIDVIIPNYSENNEIAFKDCKTINDISITFNKKQLDNRHDVNTNANNQLKKLAVFYNVIEDQSNTKYEALTWAEI